MGLEGWVKSTDPATGRTFYANHLTRQTQWDPPAGWVDEAPLPPPPAPPARSDEDDLPDGWEVMHDQASGRPFYVDHARRITTWEHPGRKAASASAPAAAPAASRAGTSTGFGFIPEKTASSPSPSSFPRQEQQHHAVWEDRRPPATAARTAPSRASSFSSTGSSNAYFAGRSQHNLLLGHQADVTTNDVMPPLDFKVVSVKDELRSTCPCCDTPFTISKRRHHCRLCGDVYCDTCSNHRVLLPLEEKQYEKPVRVCDDCHVDVNKGNYFSMRRYLTPLLLFDPSSKASGVGAKDAQGNDEITSDTVAAALSSLTSDLDAILVDPSGYEDKMSSITAHVLVPAIGRHLKNPNTSDRATRALSSLFAVGSVVGDDSYVHTMYTTKEGGEGEIMDDLLAILEWSGSSRKTLVVQEQASRALFYLSDPKTLATLMEGKTSSRRRQKKKHNQRKPQKSSNRFPAMSRDENDEEYDHFDDDDDVPEDQITLAKYVERLDVHRALRSVLDHATSSTWPSLQRWAAATIRNLILEDGRRASLREMTGSNYESFTSQLVSTGGIMILCSLVGADDADTRAHATAALSAVLVATRAMEDQNQTPSSSFSQSSRKAESAIIHAVVEGGGCDMPLAQLLLSSDDAVASMGASFAASLVSPFLQDPRGTAHASDGGGIVWSILDEETDVVDGLSAYRDVALALSLQGGCLPALVSLLRGNRPLELRRVAMEVLAAMTLAIGGMASALSASNDEEGDAIDHYPREPDAAMPQGRPAKIRAAIVALEHEAAAEVALDVLTSTNTSSHRGGSSNHAATVELREGAGIVLGRMAECSPRVLAELRSRHALSTVLTAAGGDRHSDLASASTTWRGDWATRHMGLLDAAAAILFDCWHSDVRSEEGSTGDSSPSLELLLEALDAGAIPLVSSILATDDIHLRNGMEEAYGAIRRKVACCRMLTALFGIARTDQTAIGAVRLYDAVDVEAASSSRRGLGDVASSAVSVLQSAAMLHSQQAVQGQENLPTGGLVVACILAVGSICGSTIHAFSESKAGEFRSEDFASVPDDADDYASRRRDACLAACAVLLGDGGNGSVLPSMLVGSYGEGAMLPALRLALAVAQNGPVNLRPQIAQSGVLIPVNDLLRNALTHGERFTFSASLALIRFCGADITTTNTATSGALQSVRDSIRIVASVLSIDDDDNPSVQALKTETILSLEALSANAAYWDDIATDSFLPLSEYLNTTITKAAASGTGAYAWTKTAGAALRTIRRIGAASEPHAASAARSGICRPLARLVTSRQLNDVQSGDDLRTQAMALLHALLSHRSVRSTTEDVGPLLTALDGICVLLGSNVSSVSKEDAKISVRSPEDATRLGLEILLLILSDFDDPQRFQQGGSHGGMMASEFVDVVTKQPEFLSALISTLVSDLRIEGLMSYAVEDLSGAVAFDEMYGPPLVMYDGPCGQYSSPRVAATNVLFSIANHCSLVESNAGDAFWDLFMLHSESPRKPQQMLTAIAACAVFLNVLMDDKKGVCVPPRGNSDFVFGVALTVVRKTLLDGLQSHVGEMLQFLNEGEEESDDKKAAVSVLRCCHVIKICLTLCDDSELFEPAFHSVEAIVEELSDDFLQVMVSDKTSLTSLFEILNRRDDSAADDAGAETVAKNMDHIRRLMAEILGRSAVRGLLGPAVERMGLRRQGVAALSAACIVDEALDSGRHGDVDVSLLCLSGLVGIFTTTTETLPAKTETEEDEDEMDEEEFAADVTKLRLTTTEARALAATLGKRISELVLARIEDRKGSFSKKQDVTQAPEVALLCALASMKESLPDLCKNGGLEALSAVASEGELTAIDAMHEACKDDPSVVLDVEGHLSVMQVLCDDTRTNDEDVDLKKLRAVEASCLRMLASLCRDSKRGRVAVTEAELSSACIEVAAAAVSELLREEEPATKEEGDGEADEEQEDVGHDGDEPKRPMVLAKLEEDPSLEIAAFAFLGQVAQVSALGKDLLTNSHLMETATEVASSKSTPLALQMEAVEFLATLAMWANEDEEGHSASVLASMFCTVLKSFDIGGTGGSASSSSSSSSSLSQVWALKRKNAGTRQQPSRSGNRHRVLASAFSGLERVLDFVGDEEHKATVLQLASGHFVKLVDGLAVSATSTSRNRPSDRFAGLAAANVTLLFLQSLEASLEKDDALLTAMIRLVLLQPKADVEGEDSAAIQDQVLWNAAHVHILQCLAVLLRRRGGTNWEELIADAESKSKAGRRLGGGGATASMRRIRMAASSAPLPAAASDPNSFVSVLRGISKERTNGAAALAASRILASVDW